MCDVMIWNLGLKSKVIFDFVLQATYLKKQIILLTIVLHDFVEHLLETVFVVDSDCCCFENDKVLIV